MPAFDEAPTGLTENASTVQTVDIASVPAAGSQFYITRRSSANDNITGCDDGVDGAYSLVGKQLNGAATRYLNVYGKVNLTAGARTGGTCTFGDAQSTRSLSITYSGSATTSAFDGATVTGTFASAMGATTSNIVTTYTDVKIVCALAISFAVISTTTPATQRQSTSSTTAVSDLDAATPGTYTISWTFDAANEGAYVCWALKSTTSALPTPTFTAAPAIGTRTTSAIPITFTSDTTGTVYGVRMTDGSSTPTCDAIEAQTVTGGLTYFSEAVVATVADTEEFGSLTDGTVVDLAFCIEDGSANDSTVATIANAYKIPAFSVAPSVSAEDDNDYTITKTLDGPGTVYAVACRINATAPTVAQVEAGNCTGDVAALAAISDDATGTMVLGGALSRWNHDLFIAGTYGGQHQAAPVSALDSCLDAPANFQIQNCPAGLTSIAMGSPVALWNVDFAPDIATGDSFKCPLVTDPGLFGLTVGLDGNFSYTGDESRQYWTCSTLRAATGDIHAETLEVYNNNGSPSSTGVTITVVWEVGVVIPAAIDLNLLFTDPETDVLTYAVTAGTLPTGVTLDVNLIGDGETPTVEDEDGVNVDVTGTDIAGATAVQQFQFVTLDTLPLFDCAMMEYGLCTDNIIAQFFGAIDVNSTFECSATVASGVVITQTPAAMAEVEPYTEVDLVVSSGVCGGGGGVSGLLERMSIRIGIGL